MTYKTKSNIKLLTMSLVVLSIVVGCAAMVNIVTSLTDAAWVVQEANTTL